MAIQAPPLEGWLTLSELAARLGYTRQGVNYLAEHQKIKSLRSVGGGQLFLMREAEVAEVAAQLSRRPESRRAHGGQDNQHTQVIDPAAAWEAQSG